MEIPHPSPYNRPKLPTWKVLPGPLSCPPNCVSASITIWWPLIPAWNTMFSSQLAFTVSICPIIYKYKKFVTFFLYIAPLWNPCLQMAIALLREQPRSGAAFAKELSQRRLNTILVRPAGKQPFRILWRGPGPISGVVLLLWMWPYTKTADHWTGRAYQQ